MTTVSKEEIILNPAELRLRLGGHIDGMTSELVNKYKPEVYAAMRPCYCFKETQVRLYDGGCDLGFGEINSKNLRKNLDGCSRAYVFAATLGSDIDRLLKKTALLSAAGQFVTDAIASAAIEALCDLAQERMPCKTKPRFSPGFGDLYITYQEPILDFINARKEIGIVLTQSFLMTPTKSVSAIMGIRE